LQTSIWRSPASSVRLMTSSFTANDMIFLFVFTETFFKHVFSRFWLITNNYGQNIRTVTSPHTKHTSRDATYATLRHTKQTTKLLLCALLSLLMLHYLATVWSVYLIHDN
jgi:hypothetical protein